MTYRMYGRNVVWIVGWALCLGLTWGPAAAGSDDFRDRLRAANRLYRGGQVSEALTAYGELLADHPADLRALFNQGNCHYRLDDLAQAEKAYREVAAQSRDMDLVRRAKYNLGNTLFQRGMKKTDSDLRAAIADVNDAIRAWQSVLDLQPEDPHAAHNIEVARLTVKDLLDRLKNQVQDPNQPQDPNQAPNGQRRPGNNGPAQDPNQASSSQQDGSQQAGSQGNKAQPGTNSHDNSVQDPNQGQETTDPNSTTSSAGQDPNEERGKQVDSSDGQSGRLEDPNRPAQDMTAQAILDQEQRNKQRRRARLRANHTPVLKDW